MQRSRLTSLSSFSWPSRNFVAGSCPMAKNSPDTSRSRTCKIVQVGCNSALKSVICERSHERSHREEAESRCA